MLQALLKKNREEINNCIENGYGPIFGYPVVMFDGIERRNITSKSSDNNT